MRWVVPVHVAAAAATLLVLFASFGTAMEPDSEFRCCHCSDLSVRAAEELTPPVYMCVDYDEQDVEVKPAKSTTWEDCKTECAELLCRVKTPAELGCRADTAYLVQGPDQKGCSVACERVFASHCPRSIKAAEATSFQVLIRMDQAVTCPQLPEGFTRISVANTEILYSCANVVIFNAKGGAGLFHYPGGGISNDRKPHISDKLPIILRAVRADSTLTVQISPGLDSTTQDLEDLKKFIDLHLEENEKCTILTWEQVKHLGLGQVVMTGAPATFEHFAPLDRSELPSSCSLLDCTPRPPLFDLSPDKPDLPPGCSFFDVSHAGPGPNTVAEPSLVLHTATTPDDSERRLMFSWSSRDSSESEDSEKATKTRSEEKETKGSARSEEQSGSGKYSEYSGSISEYSEHSTSYNGDYEYSSGKGSTSYNGSGSGSGSSSGRGEDDSGRRSNSSGSGDDDDDYHESS